MSPTNTPKLTAQDKKWMAQDDARVLISAGVIQDDRARLSRAIKEVKNIASQKEKEAKAAKKVAKVPMSKNPKTKK